MERTAPTLHRFDVDLSSVSEILFAEEISRLGKELSLNIREILAGIAPSRGSGALPNETKISRRWE